MNRDVLPNYVKRALVCALCLIALIAAGLTGRAEETAPAPSAPPVSEHSADAAPDQSAPVSEAGAGVAIEPPVMALGARGSDVAALQVRLKELDFFEGGADGVYGADTVSAVSAFQTYLIERGWREGAASGEVDGATFAMLSDKRVLDERFHLVEGSEGEDVKKLQARLIELALLSGEPDGVYGQTTAAAVREFQEYEARMGRQVTPNGEASEETIEALNDDAFAQGAYRLNEGDAGEDVKALQKRLIELGLFEGVPDGDFGPATAAAVQAFERYCVERKGEDMPISGDADRALLALMNDARYVDGLFDLKQGDGGEAVSALQQKLYVLGYLTGAPDGDYGPGTVRAVTAFQQTLIGCGVEGAQASGIADSVTRAALADPDFSPFTDHLMEGDSGEAVTRLQNRLTALGYLAGADDGFYGEETADAVRLFQKGAGILQTGVAGRAVQKLLFSEAALERDVAILRELGSGDKGAGVKRLQQRLIRYDLLAGKADGSYGKATASAVKLLEKLLTAQGTEGVTEDGRASVAEQEAFYADNFSIYAADYAEGDEGDFVPAVEKRLSELNYTDTAADRVFDAHSAAALKLFQQAAGLEATGVTDRATVEKLYAEDAAPAEHALRRDLELGDRGRTVRELEDILARYGFMDGLADDEYDAGTARALTRLRDHAAAAGLADGWADMLPDTDRASAQLQEKLIGEPLPVYLGDADSGEQLRRVQRRLYTLYYLGKYSVDGKLGSGTQKAIRSFQKENGLSETGEADLPTQSALFSDSARGNPMPYMLEVDLSAQHVYAYRRNEDGSYEKIRSMICSTGYGVNATPTGVFVRTRPQDRWHYFVKYTCWAQYTYVIDGNILFHSVLYSARSTSSLRSSSLYNLGNPASHGCVRLTVADAKWIFEHCGAGTPVVVR